MEAEARNNSKRPSLQANWTAQIRMKEAHVLRRYTTTKLHLQRLEYPGGCGVSPFNQVASRTLARLLLGFWPGHYWAFGQIATGLWPGCYWALFTRWCCGRAGDRRPIGVSLVYRMGGGIRSGVGVVEMEFENGRQ
jgi:hypothetical protein